jgi:hypothetical protein
MLADSTISKDFVAALPTTNSKTSHRQIGGQRALDNYYFALSFVLGAFYAKAF